MVRRAGRRRTKRSRSLVEAIFAYPFASEKPFSSSTTQYRLSSLYPGTQALIIWRSYVVPRVFINKTIDIEMQEPRSRTLLQRSIVTPL